MTKRVKTLKQVYKQLKIELSGPPNTRYGYNTEDSRTLRIADAQIWLIGQIFREQNREYIRRPLDGNL